MQYRRRLAIGSFCHKHRLDWQSQIANMWHQFGENGSVSRKIRDLAAKSACRNALAALASLALAACAGPQVVGSQANTVEVGIAAINDFHGNLTPPGQSVLAPDGKGDYVSVPAGGVAYLASAIDSIRAKYANHLTVSAGDLIGGSPITSSLFLDEPTIGVMNRIGVDFNAVGNHEFDRGRAELLRMAHGGCAKYTMRQPCRIETFTGAQFAFLAGNTITETGEPLFPASALKSLGKGKTRVTIGLIGLTLKGTGPLSPPDGIKGLHWADEADTANAEVAKLKAGGADAIVLLIHQGSRTGGDADPNGCTGLYGGLNSDIRPILDRLDPAIDVVISGHTHWSYVCDYPSRDPSHHFLLTSAGLWGEIVTDIALTIDPARHRVVSAHAHNIIVQSPAYRGSVGEKPNTQLYPNFAARPDIAAYVQRYVDAAAAFSQRQAGWLAAPAMKPEGKLANTGGALAHLVADAQLAASASAGAQIALMNPFGARRSLEPAADGSLTFGQIYAVQPFMNELVTLTLSGADLKVILEQGPANRGPEQILSVSSGYTYSYDRSRPAGDRITTMALHGQPIIPAQSYRVTVSTFLANGGDNFSEFAKGHDRTIGMTDIAAFEAWLKATPPRQPPTEEREIDLKPELKFYKAPAPPGQHY